jgi:hypothetical protein
MNIVEPYLAAVSPIVLSDSEAVDLMVRLVTTVADGETAAGH